MPAPHFADCDLSLDAFFPTDAVGDYDLSIDLEPIQAQAEKAHPHGKAEHANPAATASPSPATSASNSPAPSTSGSATPLPGVVPQRCGYRTGKCQNLQAIKRNGKLHKLCEFHREKANQNQKKLDRKKRLLRFSPYDSHSPNGDSRSAKAHSSSSSSSRKTLETSPRSIDGENAMLATDPTSLHEAPLGLGCEELAIFFSIMSSDISRASSPAHGVESMNLNASAATSMTVPTAASVPYPDVGFANPMYQPSFMTV